MWVQGAQDTDLTEDLGGAQIEVLEEDSTIHDDTSQHHDVVHRWRRHLYQSDNDMVD